MLLRLLNLRRFFVWSMPEIFTNTWGIMRFEFFCLYVWLFLFIYLPSDLHNFFQPYCNVIVTCCSLVHYIMFWLLIADCIQAKAKVFRKTPRDHGWYARRSGGLDGWGGAGIPTSSWNSSSCYQLLGPISLPHRKCETRQAAAGWHGCLGDCCVSHCLFLMINAFFSLFFFANSLC